MPDLFWAFLALFFWIEHTQYMAGHETIIFVHKTPEEKRIQGAMIKKLEREAGL